MPQSFCRWGNAFKFKLFSYIQRTCESVKSVTWLLKASGSDLDSINALIWLMKYPPPRPPLHYCLLILITSCAPDCFTTAGCILSLKRGQRDKKQMKRSTLWTFFPTGRSHVHKLYHNRTQYWWWVHLLLIQDLRCLKLLAWLVWRAAIVGQKLLCYLTCVCSCACTRVNVRTK